MEHHLTNRVPSIPFHWHRLPRPILALAPMEDVTDTVFRSLIRKWTARAGGPDRIVMFTEFTRVDRAVRAWEHCRNGGAGAASPAHGRLAFTAAERPLVAQLWGTRPEEFVRAAAALEALGFDGIDLNMGCPVRKIRKAGACSALIGTPTLAAEIIAACREGSQLPLSVKTRIGLSRVRTEEWCGFLLDQPIDALTVHPRTADQMSEGWADWREVRRVVQMRDARRDRRQVVIGNGDVRTLAHAGRLVSQTGADGVMIGRGIFHDPLLFARDPAQDQPDVWRRTAADQRLRYLREHVAAFTSFWGTRRNYEVLKKFFRNYAPAGRPGQELLDRLYATRNADEALRAIDEAIAGLRGP